MGFIPIFSSVVPVFHSKILNIIKLNTLNGLGYFMFEMIASANSDVLSKVAFSINR